MLYRAPIQLIKSGKISRDNAHIVVVMRHFPRFTPRELINEYVPQLAPDPELFKEFKAKQRDLKDHNEAFKAVDYENRFRLNADGMRQLERISQMARTKTVYLVCQCGYEDRCHADLLLITARSLFAAQVSQIPHRYEEYQIKAAPQPTGK